jgi:hypothetical protein
MAGNPIQYTSRTFNTILADINAVPELADKPDWFKRLIAGIGDVLSIWNNATANDNYLRTAFTRQSVADLLALIDYQLAPQSTATGTQIFYMSRTVAFPATFLAADLKASIPGGTSVSSRIFEARDSVTISAQETTQVLSLGADAGTDVLTVSRAFLTGELVRITGTSLAPPLATGTDYYAIRVSDTEIKLATTLANAFAGIAVDLTDTNLDAMNLNFFSFAATIYQQETRETQNIGASDGVSTFQEFDLPDLNILRDTIGLTINGQAWTRVETFIDSGPADRHFRLLYNTDNSSLIQFGNGEYGLIPPAFDVLADYAFGGGADSNVASQNRINVYAGGSGDITGTINPGAVTGGADPESIEDGKRLGPLLIKARDRFVTSGDGEALTEAFGGTSQSKVNRNAFGVLSAQVITIANGGGNPGTAFQDSLQQYLIDRTVLESIDVRVEDTTITTVNVTSAAKMLTGFTYANVEKYFRLGWKLFLHESGKEIQDDYIANGISSAVSLLNTILSESFSSNDFDQISQMLDQLEPRLIGEDIQESDAFAFIQGSVNGIDFMTISAPSFPISIADDEITTPGTLTLSEIV